MTNSERITAHNARLAAMKETVAALPDAGAGGGAVETCTVEITADNGQIENYIATIYTDGECETVYDIINMTFINTPLVLSNVVCGSSVYIQASYTFGGFTCTNCEMTRTGANSAMVRITAGEGSVATIHCYNND